MDIIHVTDSHGVKAPMDALIGLIRDRGADLVIHTGDMLADAEYLRSRLAIPVWSVPGNCDRSDPDRPAERAVTAGGVRILMCHGHTLSVKMTLERLMWRAEAEKARLALFGHTHAPYLRCVEGLWLVNPGALMDRRYALISLRGDVIKPRLMTL